MISNPIFHRLELLVGPKVIAQMARSKVIVFGVGGVGGWCAEGLVRNGVGQLTIVDSDVVCMTNINRQLQATAQNVGESKVEELAARLRTINPQAEIQTIQAVYKYDNSEQFRLGDYDFVIDAIDSLSSKFDLITRALESGATLYSSMGASVKLDPTRLKVGSFWKIEGCPLAKKVRKRLRKWGSTEDFTAVYSDEQLPMFPPSIACGSGNCVCPSACGDGDDEDAHEWCSAKARINGSAVHVTATAGMILAGLVLDDVVHEVGDHPPAP